MDSILKQARERITLMDETERHRKINNILMRCIPDELINDNKVKVSAGGHSLLYHGRRFSENAYLVNINEVELDVLTDLNRVEPDFMVFQHNKYIQNESGTRIAGYPDLVVEVWSRNNRQVEEDFKMHLYSTSPVTEHWYFNQTDNKVLCFFGEERLEDKTMKEILVSRYGLQFDLRKLAI